MLLCIILFVGYLVRSNHRLSITRQKYVNSNIPKDFNGFKIVHLSDIHGDLPGDKAECILDIVKKEQPDMVVITGDVVDHVHNKARHRERVQKLLWQLGENFNCFYVTGNHEYMHPECEDIIAYIVGNTKIKMLSDSTETVERGEDRIWVCGLNDPYALYQGKVPTKYETPVKQFKEVLSRFTTHEKEFSILLSHRPEFFKNYVRQGFDLVFAGHAHGGQFRGPCGISAIAPDQGLFPKFTAGKHQSDRTTMYISRGLGNSVVPIRIFNNPEIVVVECYCEV